MNKPLNFAFQLSVWATDHRGFLDLTFAVRVGAWEPRLRLSWPRGEFLLCNHAMCPWVVREITLWQSRKRRSAG